MSKTGEGKEIGEGSKIREGNARKLERASEYLAPLVEGHPDPATCIRPALALATDAHGDMCNYLTGVDRGALRTSILRLRAVLAALDDCRRIRAGDYAAVARCAVDLRAVAAHVAARNARAHIRAEPTMTYSATGQRFGSLTAVATQAFVTIEDGSRITVPVATPDDHHEDVVRSTMPTTVDARTGIATYRCPIVALLTRYVGDGVLQRSGFRWRRGIAAGGLSAPGVKRTASDGLHPLTLEDQLLIGFDRAALAADREGTIQRALAALRADHGPLVAPQGERRHLLISPGNPLSWLWVVSARDMSITHLCVHEANFPWKTQRVAMTSDQRKLVHDEARSIDERVTCAIHEGREIDVHDLSRQSRLMEALDRSVDVASRDASLAARRVAMARTIALRVAPLTARLEECREQIRDIDDAPSMRALTRALRVQMRTLMAAIVAIREQEMARARRSA